MVSVLICHTGQPALACANCSEARLLNGQANLLGDAGTILGINLVEVREDALLDVASALAQATSDVVDDLLAHGVIEDVAEEGAGLLVVRVGVLVSVATSLASERDSWAQA